MVYIDPNIDSNYFTTLKSDTEPPDRNVRISYNGVDIHDLTKGNVPLVTLKENTNASPNGNLYGSTVNITLNGKILSYLNGATGVLESVNKLRTLFLGTGNLDASNQYNGHLRISCGSGIEKSTPPNSGIFNATGVRLLNLSIDESGDNWTQGTDYSVELEYHIPRPLEYAWGYAGYSVRSTVDSWTIEPLEDYTYYAMTGFLAPTVMKQEYHNPKLKPNPANNDSGANKGPQPPIAELDPNNPGNRLQFRLVNIPVYRVSRKLSAVGLPSKSGLTGTFYAYQNAQRWVQDRLYLAHNTGVFLPNSISLATGDGNYLYNHLRTTDFSIYDGSYSINESWLAMPIKVGYLEDYSVSVNTEEGHIKTVKIQGEVRGLIKGNNNFVSGISGLVPTTGSTRIELNNLMTTGSKPETSGVSYVVPDAYTPQNLNTIAAGGGDILSRNTVLTNSKYFNANNAWLNDIKPYLFRRANMVMHSVDRDKNYINNVTIPRKIPGNPIYSFERPLNVNPISTSETHDPRKGTVNYTYEYSNKFKYFANTISESITISDTHPSQVINEAFVLGRRIGPVLQDLGTVTSAKKEINLEIIVVPPTSIQGFLMSHPECPLCISGELYGGINTMLNQLKPFGDRPRVVFGNLGERGPIVDGGSTGDEGNLYVASDTHSWEPNAGVYRRNVAWVYQHCSINTQTLDH